MLRSIICKRPYINAAGEPPLYYRNLLLNYLICKRPYINAAGEPLPYATPVYSRKHNQKQKKMTKCTTEIYS